jgi:hypothetical protein
MAESNEALDRNHLAIGPQLHRVIHPESIQILPLVDPKEKGPSADDLKRFRDAGANRILLLSQKTAFDTSRGKSPELARHFAQVVERAHGI